ncbi:MAG: preprotein translocase subunit SecG [Spirochaetia bacterium]
MGALGIAILVIFVITCILLIIIVLMQDEQGEGIGGIFGGGSTSAFGSRSGNVLTKFTGVLGALFLICSFGLAWINRTNETGDVIGAARRQQAQEQTVEEWWAPQDEEGEAQAE